MPDSSMSDSSVSDTSTAETLVEDFETFFIELPADVRNDLWFMMVILSDENFVFHDGTDIYERSAQGLFQAKTRIGRLGNLIQAAAIFDVYFAMDAGERFGRIVEKGIGQVLGSDRFAAHQDGAALDRVAKFADVAGPSIARERRGGAR